MKTIEDVLNASTSDLMKKLTNILLTYYPKDVWVFEDDFVYAVGENPICIMAHVDTVRDPQIKNESKFSRRKKDDKPMALWQDRNVLRNANGVLGADDRAGVFACLELVRKCKKEKLPMPSVILANGEESGGLGIGVFCSTDAFKKHDKERTRLFVEMDRCNATEWVTYGSPLPTEVVEYIESFGFHKANGSYSDVADVQDEYLIPGVNLSIGYYKQHTDDERLHIDEMYMTIGRVMNMLRDPIEKLYQVKPYERWSQYGGYDWRDWHDQTPSRTTTTTSNSSDALLRGSGKETKKDESGSAGSTNSGFPHDKKGRREIDEAMEIIAKDGWCVSCGFEWEECECGHILMEVTKKLEDEEIAFLLSHYITDGARLQTLLEVYLESQTAAKGGETEEDTSADPKDPFHVGEEGAPIVIDAEIINTTTAAADKRGELDKVLLPLNRTTTTTEEGGDTTAEGGK